MIENYFGTSLRIFHESLSPEELSTLLKRSSDWSGEKGSPRSVGGMPGSLATWASNYWCVDFAKGEEVDIQLARLAEFLSARENVLSQIVASGARADIYLFVAPGKSMGIELAPELLHLLGRIGASIGIEFSVDAKERSPG